MDGLRALAPAMHADAVKDSAHPLVPWRSHLQWSCTSSPCPPLGVQAGGAARPPEVDHDCRAPAGPHRQAVPRAVRELGCWLWVGDTRVGCFAAMLVC